MLCRQEWANRGRSEPGVQSTELRGESAGRTPVPPEREGIAMAVQLPKSATDDEQEVDGGEPRCVLADTEQFFVRRRPRCRRLWRAAACRCAPLWREAIVAGS